MFPSLTKFCTSAPHSQRAVSCIAGYWERTCARVRWPVGGSTAPLRLIQCFSKQRVGTPWRSMFLPVLWEFGGSRDVGRLGSPRAALRTTGQSGSDLWFHLSEQTGSSIPAVTSCPRRDLYWLIIFQRHNVAASCVLTKWLFHCLEILWEIPGT